MDKLALLLFLVPIAVFSQTRPREILRGMVVSDSLKVENITVLNLTSNIGAVTDEEGGFTIYARPADTLLFSSITFRSQHLVLKPEDFEVELLFIKLDVNVTVLDEVVITPLTGDLANDSKRTKTHNLGGFDAAGIAKSTIKVRKHKYSEKVNSALPQTESVLTGVDFVEIGKMIFGKGKKKKDAHMEYVKGRSFLATAKARYTHHFFTQTLKIPHEEIGLFLNYCDKGAETAWLLEPENEFQLTDYLVRKSTEYLKE